jgi:hypothetical protein
MSRLASILALSLVVAPLARAQDPAPAAPAADAAKPADAAAPPADAAKPADAPAVPPAEAPPANGALSVSSTPAGKLFLDGKDTGLMTPVVDLPVAPGAHTIKVVEEATGRETATDFTMEAGGSLSLNLNLPEAAAKPAADTATATPTADVATPEPAAAAEAPAPWTWMTVAGWAGLGLGTIGLLSGAVVLTTPTDPDQGPLGFGLFGAGVGLLIGGGVLLYLDTELADSDDAKPADEKPADAPAAASR